MQVGVKCPRGRITHEECRTCALNPLHPCMLTPDILELMRACNDEEPDDTVFSPSRLLDCPRKQLLMEDVPYYTDIEHAYPLVRGHMVHSLFETIRSRTGSDYPGALLTVREVRLHTPILTSQGVYKLEQVFGSTKEPAYDLSEQDFTGKPDLIVALPPPYCEDDGKLHVKVLDYKSKKAIKHELVKALPEHQVQLNLYALLVTRELLRQTSVLARLEQVWHGSVLPSEVVVDELEILYLDMARPRRFTSAGWLQDKGKRLSRFPDTYDVLDLAPIEMVPLDRVERFVKARIEVRLAGRKQLPDVLENPADRWRCDYCPVAERCRELAEQAAEAALDGGGADDAAA